MHDIGLSRCSHRESCALWRILDATRNLAAPLGVDEALEKTIAAAVEVLDADRVSVFLYDAKNDELYIKVSICFPETGPSQNQSDHSHHPNRDNSSRIIRFSADRGIAGQTAQSRQLINVPDCYADPRFNREVDRQTGYVTRCLLSVPLLGVDEALVGVLQVLNKRVGTFDEDDEQIAMTLAAQCAVVLQRAMLVEEYVLKQKMERDLALAREIQLSALPQQMPVLAGYELAAWSQPAEETGGDIYDAIDLGKERVALLMADATGHGIGPALSVSQLRAMFRMGLLVGSDLDELMPRINSQLRADLPPGRFITAFAGILDGTEQKIRYHSGGQAPLMHYHIEQLRVEWLEASAPPMGLLAPAAMIPPSPVDMLPGDIFALISDGFFEYRNAAGEQFGIERFEDFIRSHAKGPLEDLRQGLCETIRVFAGVVPQEDDMTIVLVRRKAS